MSSARDLIIINALDFDSCFGEIALFLNDNYRTKIAGYKGTAADFLRAFLYISPFGKQLLEQVKDPRVKRIIFVSSSNRYTLYSDCGNRRDNFEGLNNCDGGSVFGFHEAFVEFLQSELGEAGKKISYDRRTYWSIWHELPADNDHQLALKMAYPLRSFESLDKLKELAQKLLPLYGNSDCTDLSKIAHLHALRHSFASSLKKELGEVDIHFSNFDDNKRLVDGLYYAAAASPQQLPKNLSFCSNHFDLYHETASMAAEHILSTTPLISGVPVKGEGEIDTNVVTATKALKQHCARYGIAGPLKTELSQALIEKLLADFNTSLKFQPLAIGQGSAYSQARKTGTVVFNEAPSAQPASNKKEEADQEEKSTLTFG